MTPKKTATNLIKKFMLPIDGLHQYPMCFDTAKQCALIAVDEMIHYLEIVLGVDKQDFKFWQQVKAELEKK